MDTLQFFEDNGYVVMRDFWPDGELDALQTQLDELGRLAAAPQVRSATAARWTRCSPTRVAVRWKSSRILPATCHASRWRVFCA
jgi:hypothetical protein